MAAEAVLRDLHRVDAHNLPRVSDTFKGSWPIFVVLNQGLWRSADDGEHPTRGSPPLRFFIDERQAWDKSREYAKKLTSRQDCSW